MLAQFAYLFVILLLFAIAIQNHTTTLTFLNSVSFRQLLPIIKASHHSIRRIRIRIRMCTSIPYVLHSQLPLYTSWIRFDIVSLLFYFVRLFVDGVLCLCFSLPVIDFGSFHFFCFDSIPLCRRNKCCTKTKNCMRRFHSFYSTTHLFFSLFVVVAVFFRGRLKISSYNHNSGMIFESIAFVQQDFLSSWFSSPLSWFRTFNQRTAVPLTISSSNRACNSQGAIICYFLGA